jgi:hypothetical protein
MSFFFLILKKFRPAHNESHFLILFFVDLVLLQLLLKYYLDAQFTFKIFQFYFDTSNNKSILLLLFCCVSVIIARYKK